MSPLTTLKGYNEVVEKCSHNQCWIEWPWLLPILSPMEVLSLNCFEIESTILERNSFLGLSIELIREYFQGSLSQS